MDPRTFKYVWQAEVFAKVLASIRPVRPPEVLHLTKPGRE
jgi:hypothetical protein